MNILIVLLVTLPALGYLCWMWVKGIDYMKENHPDYKGNDLFGEFDEDDKNQIGQMEQKQYEDIMKLLQEIKELVATTQSQPTTKITVVGNGQGQKTTKGLKSDEDFSL